MQFDLEAQQEDLYFLCNQTSLLAIARALDDVPGLTLAERHQLCCAPVDEKNGQVFEAFVNFVRWFVPPLPFASVIQVCTLLRSCICYAIEKLDLLVDNGATEYCLGRQAIVCEANPELVWVWVGVRAVVLHLRS